MALRTSMVTLAVRFFGAVFLFVLGGAASAFALEGDVNDDGKIDLADAVLSAQVLSGISISAGDFVSNWLDMEFQLISPGSFEMGSSAGEPGRQRDETLHTVEITRPFYIQTTEVTQAQWAAVMGANPSASPECGSDCPVENVSWSDVQVFIQKLNQEEGTARYRLPTEAEWEYAARAGTESAVFSGSVAPVQCEYDATADAVGWYCGNSGGRLQPVARKAPNPWGIYDMHGNVGEWCQDYYEPVYPAGPVSDPQGPASGSSRVTRGGSWSGHATMLRSADRDYASPGLRVGDLGFRLVREP